MLGYCITTIDKNKNPYDGILKNINFFYGNILNIDIKTIIEKQDVIIVLAGKSGALDSFNDYKNYLENNSLLLLNILDIIKNLDKKPIIFFPSTRLVYKANKNGKVTESDALMPLSPYAIHKLSCEYFLQAYQNMYNIEYIIFRISIPYGFDLTTKANFGIVNNIIKKSINDEDIIIFGKGSQLRDIIYIEDLVEILIKTIENIEIMKNNIYNLGGKEIISLYNIANTIISIFGKGKIVYKEWPKEYLSIETGDLYLDSTKIYNAINYIPKYELKDICKKMLINENRYII